MAKAPFYDRYLITPRDFGFFIAVDLLTYNIVRGTRIWYGPILGAALLTALFRKSIGGSA